MATIIIQLDPSHLANPDLDIRYVLPGLLIARSKGRLKDDGYDYVGDSTASPILQLYLTSDDTSLVLPMILKLLATEQILGNDLSTLPVAVEDEDRLRIVHPIHFDGIFHRPRSRHPGDEQERLS